MTNLRGCKANCRLFTEEMNTLAKKNPNDAVNKFKLGLVNSVLTKANSFLGKDRRPFGDFDCFDEAAMPSTSDVLVIISQYSLVPSRSFALNIYATTASEIGSGQAGEKFRRLRRKNSNSAKSYASRVNFSAEFFELFCPFVRVAVMSKQRILPSSFSPISSGNFLNV